METILGYPSSDGGYIFHEDASKNSLPVFSSPSLSSSFENLAEVRDSQFNRSCKSNSQFISSTTGAGIDKESCLTLKNIYYSSESDSSPIPQPQEYSDEEIHPIISANSLLELTELNCNLVHKLWGMIRLDISEKKRIDSSMQSLGGTLSASSSSVPIDFVFVLDHSSSMRAENKLDFVKATIEYLISQMNVLHRLCLIEFNQTVNLVTNGLLPMSNENKQWLLSFLRKIKPEGSTNLSDALFTAVGVLKSRKEYEKPKCSTVLLFTDGLANDGIKGEKFLLALKDMCLPSGLTIHTFGFGNDHDSRALQKIAFSSKGGLYYYIQTVESIAPTFGECLTGILSTVVHSVEVRFVAHDGCRLVNFYTRFPIVEHTPMKDYMVSLGSLYEHESKSILFKLSLRKVEPLMNHLLMHVIVSYFDMWSSVKHRIERTISIHRPSHSSIQSIPIELDKQMLRYMSAVAIEDAISKARENNLEAARKQLESMIASIRNSRAAQDAQVSSFCEDLIRDLMECSEAMEDDKIFSAFGIHYAYAFSTMYFMERSNGISYLSEIKKSVESWRNRSCADIGNIEEKEEEKERHARVRSGNLRETCVIQRKRNAHYGYITIAQEEGSTKAITTTQNIIDDYLRQATF